MSQRERTIVLAGGIVLGLSLLFILIVDPCWTPLIASIVSRFESRKTWLNWRGSAKRISPNGTVWPRPNAACRGPTAISPC